MMRVKLFEVMLLSGAMVGPLVCLLDNSSPISGTPHPSAEMQVLQALAAMCGVLTHLGCCDLELQQLFVDLLLNCWAVGRQAAVSWLLEQTRLQYGPAAGCQEHNTKTQSLLGSAHP